MRTSLGSLLAPIVLALVACDAKVGVKLDQTAGTGTASSAAVDTTPPAPPADAGKQQDAGAASDKTTGTQVTTATGTTVTTATATGTNTNANVWPEEDQTAPTARIEQDPEQPDPTASLPIRFRLVFSEPIAPASLKPEDIVNEGTATDAVWQLEDSGDHKSYVLVLVSAGVAGTVKPTLPAGAAQDLANNQSLASLSNDNQVTIAFNATLTGLPGARTSLDALHVTVAGAGVGGYRHKLGAAASTDCQAQAGYSTTTTPVATALDASLTALGEGALKLCVRPANAQGVLAPLAQAITAGFERDKTPPTIQPLSDKLANASFAVAPVVSGAATYAWTASAAAVVFSAPAQATTNVSATADGVYTVTLTATDDVGNAASRSFQLTWTTIAPTVQLSGTPADPSGDASFNVTVANAHEYRWALVGGGDCSTATFSGAWTAIATPITSAIAGGDGAKTLCVVGRDAVGNEHPTPTSHSWVQDRTAPTATVTTSGTIGPRFTAGATTRLTGGATDALSGVASVELALKHGASSQYLNAGATAFDQGAAVWHAATYESGAWSFDVADALLTDGAYAVEARATDLAGNVIASGSYGAGAFTWDATPPTAALANAPANPSNTNALDVTVSGASEYRYELVSGVGCSTASYGAWIAVATKITAALGADGDKTLCVQGRDAAGNEQDTPTSHTWVQDRTVPASVVTTAGARGPNTTAGPTTELAGVASDNLSGVAAVKLRVKRVSTGLYLNAGGTAFDSATVVLHDATGTTSWTFALNDSALIDDDYLIESIAYDAAGNVQTALGSGTLTWITSPDPAVLTNGPAAYSNATSLDVTVSVSNEYSYTLAAGASCPAFTPGAGVWSAWTSVATHIQIADLGADGGKVLCVYGRDPVLNVQGMPSTHAWVKDTVAPTTTVATTGALGPTSTSGADTVFTGTASDTGSALVSIEVAVERLSDNQFLDAGATGFSSGTAQWLAVGDASWIKALADSLFSDGVSYRVRARATDQAGNVTTSYGQADFAWDSVAGSAILAGTPADPSQDASLDVTVSGVTHYKYELQAAADCSTASYGAWTPVATHVTGSVGADGDHVLCVVGRDAAGNVQAAPTVYNWKKDTVAPTSAVTVASLLGPASTAGALTSFAGTASDATTGVATVQVSIQRGTGNCLNNAANAFTAACPNWVAATGTDTWSFDAADAGFADATYTMSVRAIDAAGLTQATPATASFVWDGTRPSVTIEQRANQADPTNATPIVFDLAFSEAIDPASLTVADVTQAGTAAGVTWSLSDSGDHRNFALAATVVAGNGTLAPQLAADAAADLAGNGNTASTSADGSVTLDNASPGVTIDRAGGQAAATNVLPVDFAVVFSKAIVPASFTTADLVQNGTASGITWQITDSGDHVHFTVSATAVTGQGTLIPSIAANAAVDSAANPSSVSTSTDATVLYDTTAPTAPSVTGTTPSNDDTPTWSWTAGTGGNGTFRYKLDSSDLSSGATTTTSLSYTPGSALPDGNHTLYVQERDAAGNWSASGSFLINVDTGAPTAPTVSVTTPTNDETPTFTWTAGGGGNGNYRYKLDSNDFTSGATTTATASFTPGANLGAGTFTLYVQERDAAGNWSSSGSAAVVIDLVAPTAPTVTGTTPTTDQTPTWSWTAGTGGNGNFRYKLDSSDLSTGATATTALSYTPGSNLAAGTYTLYVQERDAAGNWSAAGSFAITVDLTAPTAPTVTGTTPSNDDTPTWSWTAGTGGNGTFRYKLDSSDLTSGATTTTSLSYTPGSAQSDGNHTLYVQERDDAGNWSASGSFLINIDTVAPGAPTVTGTADTNDQTPTWSWTSAGSASGNYEYKLDSNDFTSGATATTSTSFTPGSNLSAGTYTLYVRERDAAGNWSNPGSFAITVDITPPTAPTVTGDANTSDLTPTWSWTAQGGGNGTFRYKLDSSDFTSGSTTTTATSYTPASDISQAAHTLYVQERDAAGNWSASGSFQITVDATAPSAPTVSATTPTNDQTPDFTWTSAGDGGNGNYEYKVDSSDFSSGATATTTAAFTPGTNLSEGTHTLYVRERDAAGNWSTPGSKAVVIDVTAPGAPTVTGAADTNDQTPTWSWTSAGSGSGDYEYKLDSNDFSSGATATTSTSYTPGSNLSAGTYTLYVRERDAAGNWSNPGSFAITVDITPPTAPTVTGDANTSDLTPTWSWTAQGGGNGTFRYKLDSSDFTSGSTTTTATSYTPASDISQAAHTLYVQERDAAGNWSASGSFQITVDATAPSAPTVSATTPTNDQTPDFTWTSAGDGGNGTYEYKLDSSDFTTGATSTTTAAFTPGTNLSEGTHTLYVRERDAAGNWSSAGSKAVVIDVTAPGAPTVTGTADTNDQTPTWSWTSAGSGSGDYEYKLDSNDFSSGATATTSTSYTPGSNLSAGTYTLYVRERDAAGNWSNPGSFAITVDITPPTAPTVTGDANTSDLTPTWSWTAQGGGNGTFRYKLDSSDFTSGSTTTTATSYTPASDISQAAHTLYVQERDAAGNWSASGSFQITVDATAPSAPTVSATTPTNDQTPDFTWTSAGDGGNGTYEYKLDSSDFTTGATSTTTAAFTPGTNLSEGTHTLYVRERDAAGNWSTPGSKAVVIDVTAPGAPTVTGSAATNDQTPTWSWTSAGSGSGNYEYKLDSNDFSAGTTATTSTSYTPGSNLAEGTYTLYVRERDAAGNWSNPGSFAITVDVTAPSAPTVSATTPTNDQTPDFTWVSAGDGGNGTYEYKLDSSDFSSGATSTTTAAYTPASNIAEGAHTLYVRERDAAGNWSSPGSKAISIDVTPPAAPSVTSATTPTTDKRPSWSWTAGTGDGTGDFRYKLDSTDLTTGATTTTATSYAPASDLSDGTHTLYVQERDALGNWSTSGSYAVVVDTTPPSAPTVSATTVTNDATPSWSWTAGTGGNGTFRYEIDDSDLTSGASTTTSLSYEPVGALSDGDHTLYVQERDAAGNWSTSGTKTVTVDTANPTGASGLITAADGAAGSDVRYDNDTTVYFVWTAGSDAGGSGLKDYTLKKYTQANCGGSASDTTGVTGTSTTATGTDGQTLSFKLVTFDNAGNSVTSSCSGNITIDTTPPPALATFNGATGSNYGEIALSWTYPASTTDYASIDIRRVSGATAPAAACNAGDVITTLSSFAATSYTDATGSPGSYFSYRVCIYDAAGNLTASNTKTNVMAKDLSHTIFVTSSTFNGNFKAGYGGHAAAFATGLEGADYRCQSLATAAGLGGTFMALLSDGTTDASSRVNIVGNVKTVGGTTVATSKAELWDGAVAAAVNKDENGTTYSSNSWSWTSSNADGTKVSTGYNCENWASGASTSYGTRGTNTVTTSTWMYNASGLGCQNSYRLYCINTAAAIPGPASFSAVTGATTDGDVDLTITWPADTSSFDHVTIRRLAGASPPDADCSSNGTQVGANITSFASTYTATDATGTNGSYFSYRVCVYDASGNLNSTTTASKVQSKGTLHKIFATSATFDGNLTVAAYGSGPFGDGLTGADSRCTYLANQAGLSGSWKAILSTASVNAKDRFTVSGTVYNMAGEVVATSSADLWDSSLSAAIKYDETGTALGAVNVWTGTQGTGAKYSHYCTSWTSNSSSVYGNFGKTDQTGATWMTQGSGVQYCNNSYRIFCINQ